MNMACNLNVHLFHKVEKITQDLQYVHLLGSQPGLGRVQALTSTGHALAQALNMLLQVATQRGIELPPHHQVEVAAGGLVQAIHGGQARGSA